MDVRLDGPLDLPALEASVLEHWRRNDVRSRFANRNPDGRRWSTYEGPPTVNGSPALHHVWTSTYKDVYARYQLLAGRRVDRKGGWDCQGLPVEIAVERKLGLSSKRDIESYGVAAFVEQCRQMVADNISAFENVLERFGYWVDYEHAYRTMDDDFVESIWWHIKAMWDNELLYEGYKVVPYCMRCETALSSHEMGQPGVYQATTHTAAYVGFPLADGQGELVIWTTTPWTLLANVAVAVNPSALYGRYSLGERVLIVGVERAGALLGEGASLLETIEGSSLLGRSYERPYPALTPGEGRSGVVVAWDEVALDIGTGLVHQAPAFGEEDAAVGAREGLAVLNPIGPDGRYLVGPYEGRSVLDVSDDIVGELAARNALVKAEAYEHEYPHCWRCNTPLIYWAKPTWFIRTSERRQSLIDHNEEVTWHPGHIKDGRFGNWLRDNVDWAVSRDRFWGTPLPIWRCGEGHDTCVGSRDELARLTGAEPGALRDLSLHRPEIDDIVISCPTCASPARREPVVCDVWLDSGCVPAAQYAYPLGDPEAFERNFPADFVCEALDQTRGWFYSLLAANTLVFDTTPYRNVVCLGLLVDDEGRKMSKSAGNVIDPNDVLPLFGADGVRWYLLTSGAPWGARRVSFPAITQRVSRDLATLWNVVGFYHRYSAIEGFTPSGRETSRQVLDRWVLSRLAGLVDSVTTDLEGYAAHRAAESISTFIDELSNWYVRRSRRRFWGAGTPADLRAYETLHQVLVTLATLLAPFCPHLAEVIHQATGANGDSVHMSDWPQLDMPARDEKLEEEMSLARAIASLARAARSEATLPVRQPLRTAVVVGANIALSDEVRDALCEEVNIANIAVGSDVDMPMTYKAQPNWKLFGPRHKDQAPALAPLVTALVDSSVAQLRAGRAVHLPIGSSVAIIQPDEVTITESLLAGWQAASAEGLSVAIDTTLDEVLLAEGERRNVIRYIQDARKRAGLDIQDRIELFLHERFIEISASIAAEVLATSVTPLPTDANPRGDAGPQADSGELVTGEGFAFRKA